MDEAIKNLYSYAQSEGYQKSIEEFAELLQTNDEALDAMYSYVQSQGYTKELDDFKTLIGKKKIEEEPTDSELPDGSSELLEEGWQKTSKDLEATARQLKATEGLIRERGWSQDLGIKRDSLQQEFERLNKIVHDIPAREPISSDATPPITEVSSDEPPPTIKDELDENITADFLRRKESFIVPQLNYLYGDQGFKFEEANILGQKIKVTARNGEKLGVNIGWGIINEQKKAEELKEFIRKNREESSSLARRTIGYEANAVKFKNEQQVQDSLSAISKREDFINKGLQRFLRDRENNKKALLDIDTMLPDQVAELNQKIDENNLAGQNIQQYLDSHVARESEMNIEIGKYYEMKEQQGSFGSLMMHGGARGVTGPVSEIVGYAIDMGVRGSLFVNPVATPFIRTASRKAIEKVWGEEKYKEEMIRAAIKFKFPSIPSEEEIAEMTVDELEEYFDRDADKKTSQILIESKFPILGKLPKQNELQIITNEILDRASKDIKYGKEVDGKREGGAVTAIREDALEWAAGKSISEQYEMAQREDFWVGAFYGLAQSIPSLVTGPARLPSLFMLTSGALDEEMSRNPMFNEFSEDEKAMFKMPVALIAAILENYGFRNVMNKSGLIVNILTKVMGKMPKGGGAQTFKEFVELEVKNRIAQGALVVGGAGLAELETGALQEMTEIGGKKAMNAIKGQDLFSTPEGVAQFLSQVWRAARQEAVGGITLGTIPGVAIAVRDNRFNNLTEQQIAIFREIKNDPTISQKAADDKVKMQVNQGELTEEQGEQLLADYELAIGLANELADGINNPDFAEAMDLKIRKRILEERKNNKDPSLGAVQQIENEIDGINKRLQEIKEAPESAADFPGATTQESQDIAEVTEAAEQAETTEEETESAVEVFFGETPSENTQQVSGNLVINEEGAPSSLTKSKELLRNTIKALAKTGAKAIEKLFPDVKIILHENTSQFERFAPANNSGYYNSSENVIHVDLNKAGVTTVPHEIFHATLLNKIKGGDIEAAKMAEAMMTAVRKVLPKNSKLAKQIDEYAARYKDQPDLQNEERLAELIGIMSANYRTLTPPQKNIVKKFIQDLAKYLGLENYLSEFTKEDADIIDLLNTLSRKIRTGEAITEEDIKTLEELDDGTNPIGNPTKIKIPKPREQRIEEKQAKDESVGLDTPRINVAPLFDTSIANIEEASALRKGKEYQQQLETINDVLAAYGVEGVIDEAIGGYKNDNGVEIVEISNVVNLGSNVTRDQADQIASILGALAPETQESTIAADYVDALDTTKNGEEYILQISDIQKTLEALKESGITDFTLNEQNNSLSLLNLDEGTETKEFLKKLGSLKRKLDEKGIQFEATEARGINSRYITRGRRQEILSSLKKSSIQQQLEGTSVYQKVEQALDRLGQFTTPSDRSQKNIFKENYPLSLVTPDKKIDIIKLTTEISKSGQKVWFWVADQLGIGGEFNLDAGPSYPFGDGRINENAVWASSLIETNIDKNINAADYIYVISGSPQKSLLHNAGVYDIMTNKLGSYNNFKTRALELGVPQKIRETLEAHDSWESLRADTSNDKTKTGTPRIIGTGRKKFLIGLTNTANTPNTSFHKYMQELDAYVDIESLRDGFYKANNYKELDIMLVLKPTGYATTSQHSTYEIEILGEVIGVPDEKLDAREIMPQEMVDRLAGKSTSVARETIAPFGAGVRKVAPPKRKPRPKTQDNRSQRKPQPKTQDRSQRVKTIQEVAESFNINIHSGFFNPMVDEYHLKKAVEPLRSQGFTVDRATRGSMSLHLRKYGKFYNPFDTPSDRSQRTDSFYEGIVDDLRKRKVREELIIDLLRRKYKLPVKQAKEFLGAKTLLGAIPESFKNLKGGVNAGVNLLLKVEKEVINLRAANQKRKDPLSPTEITDKVINKFMTFPEYTSQAETVKVKGKVTPKKQMSTTQAKMISDVSSLLESRGSQSMSLEITRARNIIKERKKGALSIKQTQQELINFLRRNLPKTIFTRAETLKLIRTIQQASSPELKGKNIENLMDEIEDLMTVQKGDYLLKRINQIFKGKYEVRIGGRLKGVKIDNETRKRLKRISEYLAGPKATAEMIKKLSAKLTEEIESITTTEVDIETGELTPEALMKVVDLTTALNYNEALLGDPKDVSRVENLTTALIQLENIIVRGRDALQAILQEKTKGYSQDLAILIKELTGKELNPEDKNFKQEVEDVSSTREGIAKAQKVSKNVITYFTRLMREFNSAIGFSAAQDLTAIIHQLVEFPGVVFGGQLQEIIGDQVNEATRNYKARIMMFNVLHRGALEEFYGKKWAKVHRELNQTDNIFLKNKQEVEAAQQNYDNNKTTENKRKLRDVRARNAITLSQEQMGYLLNQYKDPALNSTFKRMYGEEYERVMQEMDEKLDDRVRQYAEWQVNEFYPAMKVRFNETYKKLYYTDMPSNKYYAGPLLRKGDKVKDFDLLKGASMWIPTIGALYTKFRVQTTTPIIPKGLSESMSMYMQDMEYFDAYAVIVNRMSKLFTNPHSETIIKSIHGEQFYNLLSHQINMIATGAKTKANLQGAKYWNFFNNWFQISRLMLAPAIAIKQLTSIPTFAIEPDMGKSVAQRIGNWFKYAAKNKAQQLKVWKEVLDNSVYLQDRADKSITRSIEMYSPERYASFLPGKTTGTFIVDFLMSFIKVTDRAAIMLGGLPNYSYHKAQFIKNNPNATEQQAIDYAIRKFEKATKSTQQSYDLQDRDIFQTVNPFARGFNMFLTTPKQYLRKEIMATRDMKRALKRKWAGEYNEFAPGFAESFFQFAFYHAYMPVLFQYVTLGLPGLARDWRDDDDETLLTAAVFGNLNAIFLLGQIAEQWKEAYRGKPWFRKVTSMPIFDMAADIAVIIDKFFSAETNEETEKAYKEMFDMVNKNGLPFSLLKRWVENVQKVINGETENYGEDLLRLFNFTDYAIEGMKKKGKKTKMYSPKKRRGSGGTLDLDLDLDIDLNTDVELDELNELYF